jgi:hypothetical protein
MKYLLHKTASGKILGVLEAATPPRIDEDESYFELPPDTIVNLSTQYVENGVIVEATDRPGDNYIFNAPTKSWYKFRPDPDLADIAKSKRSKLLAECDWVIAKSFDTGLPVPQVWQDYRQALRDITAQSGFPENITWPEQPT